MKRDEFRNLIREFLLVEEEDADDPSKSKDDGETSLDAQVDRLLAQYERESLSAKNEGFNFRSMTRRFLLEAGEDETPAPDAAPGDAPKLTSDSIDVESFANSLVRLIENYDSLLEVRDTLVRRARDYLKKNYDDATVNDFMSVLRDEFDVEIGMSKFDKQADIKAPAADRAGASPAS